MRAKMERDFDDENHAHPAPDRRRGQRQPGETDRRRSRRRRTRLPGWIYRGQHVVEVEMIDISDDAGAGLVCGEQLELGSKIHLKVGLGPMRFPRPALVARCIQREDGRFLVGVAFELAPIAVNPSNDAAPPLTREAA